MFLISISGVKSAERDFFQTPFSPDSPWNTPIAKDAPFAPIPKIETYPAGINFNGCWTTGIYRAAPTDRQATLYIYHGNLWGLLAQNSKLTDPATGITYPVHTTGNEPAVEALLRHNSGGANPTPFNFYSTALPSPPNPRTAPAPIRSLQTGWTRTIFVPANAAPSPDSDAPIAILQPSGLFLECYNAIVCANGDIICAMAGFSDPASDGTGYQNGRTASLIPNYAGKIRQSELDAGHLTHALCALAPASLLAKSYVSPAAAFDMNDGYTGTLPMGSRVAIPASVDVTALGLSPKGMALARAAQEYGIYLTDRGGGGMTLQAELGCRGLEGLDHDVAIIVHHLQQVLSKR